MRFPSLIPTLLLLSLLTATFAPAGEASCLGKKWPYSKKDSPRNFRNRFDRIDRRALIGHFLAEMTQAQEKPFLQSIATYLIHTELDPDKRAFFELLQTTGELNNTKEKNRTRSIALNSRELCQIYDQVWRK
jgi:hypothetical protein